MKIRDGLSEKFGSFSPIALSSIFALITSFAGYCYVYALTASQMISFICSVIFGFAFAAVGLLWDMITDMKVSDTKNTKS